MAGTHSKTVTVIPIDDAYAWSIIDQQTQATATWVTVTAQQDGNGADTDTWDFVVQDNTNNSARDAVATVTHTNGTTSDFFTIDQAGTGVGSNNPVPTYDSLTGTPNPVNEGASITFTIAGSNLTTGTVGYTLNGTGITPNDVGIGLNGTISITGGVSSTGSLTVPILSDNLTENSETITCTIGSADSNGFATNNLSTSVVINDTSQNPTNNYVVNWNESAATGGYWAINNSTITSSNVTNENSGAQQTTFTGTPGDTVVFSQMAGTVAGMDFEQVGADPVITNSTVGITAVSEDLTMPAWPNQLTFVVSWVLPNNATTINVELDATTIAESTTKTIALHGPLVGLWTCNETTVDITAVYEDVGTPPQPAVGDSLAGVSPNSQEIYMVVAGSGAQTTTGSAVALIGKVLAFTEEEIMGISTCTPGTTTTTASASPPFGGSPYSPAPSPPPPSGYLGNA